MSDNLEELSLEDLEARKKKLVLQKEIRELEGSHGWPEENKKKEFRSLRQIQNDLIVEKARKRAERG